MCTQKTPVWLMVLNYKQKKKSHKKVIFYLERAFLTMATIKFGANSGEWNIQKRSKRKSSLTEEQPNTDRHLLVHNRHTNNSGLSNTKTLRARGLPRWRVGKNVPKQKLLTLDVQTGEQQAAATNEPITETRRRRE